MNKSRRTIVQKIQGQLQSNRKTFFLRIVVIFLCLGVFTLFGFKYLPEIIESRRLAEQRLEKEKEEGLTKEDTELLENGEEEIIEEEVLGVKEEEEYKGALAQTSKTETTPAQTSKTESVPAQTSKTESAPAQTSKTEPAPALEAKCSDSQIQAYQTQINIYKSRLNTSISDAEIRLNNELQNCYWIYDTCLREAQEEIRAYEQWMGHSGAWRSQGAQNELERLKTELPLACERNKDTCVNQANSNFSNDSVVLQNQKELSSYEKLLLGCL